LIGKDTSVVGRGVLSTFLSVLVVVVGSHLLMMGKLLVGSFGEKRKLAQNMTHDAAVAICE